MLLGSGRELASRFQKLGSHPLKVLHFIPTTFRCVEHNRFGEALSARYQTQGEQRWRAQESETVFPDTSTADGRNPALAASLESMQGYLKARRGASVPRFKSKTASVCLWWCACPRPAAHSCCCRPNQIST